MALVVTQQHGAIPQEYRQFSNVSTLSFKHLARLAMDAAKDEGMLAPVRALLADLVRKAGATSYRLDLRFHADVGADGCVTSPDCVPAHYPQRNLQIEDLHFVDLVEIAEMAAQALSSTPLQRAARADLAKQALFVTVAY